MFRPVSSHDAERAGGDVGAHALGRAAEPGVFPVVDRPGAVGGEVGDPAVVHHPSEDRGRAVAEQVRAVDQDHAGAALAGRAGSARAHSAIRSATAGGQGAGRSVGVDEDVVGAGQAPSLGERKDLEPGQVEGLGVHDPRISSRRGAGVAEVGDDDVGADAGEPFALPGVHPARAVVRLVAGDGDGQAADLLGVLDLDVAVAERQKLLALDRVLADDPVDDHLLGERLEVVLGAVDVRAEVSGEAQQFGLALDERLVGAAGQVHGRPRRTRSSSSAQRLVDEVGVGVDRAVRAGPRSGR